MFYYAVSLFLSKLKKAILADKYKCCNANVQFLFVIQYRKHSRLLKYFCRTNAGTTTPTNRISWNRDSSELV